MTTPVFLYGTLLDPRLFEIVADVPFEPERAQLPQASVKAVVGQSFPILVDQAGATAEGAIVSVDATARDRMDFYESGFGYDAIEREVHTPRGPRQAAVYRTDPSVWTLGNSWCLKGWQAQDGELARLAAQEYMGLIKTHSPEAAARAFPQIRTRAASRIRAELEPTPGALKPDLSQRLIPPGKTERPYTDYFSVREDWLSFPEFKGGYSTEVKRASFLTGDAVTILPYDPELDAVMVVRQFRHGPFVRGDLNPWTLEPAAGRIDPGETPTETARRELLEETGLKAEVLHFVGKYYPSPGAFSEYLYSYVAVADLAGRDNGIGGLLDEAEDIMAHVIPFEAAMSMIETGAANTGPLLVSLGWIALNRDRLKSKT